MRPLAYEFPADPGAVGVGDQYMLGPDYLVAPVVVQGAVERRVYFPAGTSWTSIWDLADIIAGGASHVVAAPLDIILVYRRGGAAGW